MQTIACIRNKGHMPTYTHIPLKPGEGANNRGWDGDYPSALLNIYNAHNIPLQVKKRAALEACFVKHVSANNVVFYSANRTLVRNGNKFAPFHHASHHYKVLTQ